MGSPGNAGEQPAIPSKCRKSGPRPEHPVRPEGRFFMSLFPVYRIDSPVLDKIVIGLPR